MIIDIFSTEPTTINAAGVKWWLDKSLTEYAHRKDSTGISLKDVVVWKVEEVNGYKTNLVVKDGGIVFEGTSIEGVCGHIDMMKITKQFNKKGKQNV